MDKLENWRKQIDDVDEKILNLLAKRISIVKKIGNYKKQNNLSALDEKRWDRVLKLTLSKAELLNLSKDFIKKLLTLIHKYSLKIQNEKS